LKVFLKIDSHFFFLIDESLTAEEEDQTDGVDIQLNPALQQNELQSQLSAKDEHISNLEEEIERLKADFNKHTSNLKSHLIQKDEEIDSYVEKLNQSESSKLLQDKIEELTNENSRLESELADKMSNSETDNESDWGDDWGGGGGDNEAEISTLREENESLNNEVSMKEIVLSSIESKMRQMSGGKHLDASDFSEWIDSYLENAQQEQEKASNLTELVMFLKEEMNDDSEGDDDIDFDAVYDWVVAKKEEKIFLERKITKLQNTIHSVEDSIKNFDKDTQSFQIADFNDWLTGNRLSKQPSPPHVEERPNNKSPRSDEHHALLMKIQESVRDFDEEDSSFQIKDFQEWLEKVQNKIDDLEVELLNEQEIKESEEKLRMEELAKLREMFDEKDKEIGSLKVELYNKSNVNVPDDDHQHMMTDNSSALQEQLNEALARCEALQNELKSSKDTSSALDHQTQQIDALTKMNEDYKASISVLQDEKNLSENQLKEAEQSIATLNEQLETLHSKHLASSNELREENDKLKLTAERLNLDKQQYTSELQQKQLNDDERGEYVEDVNNMKRDICMIESIAEFMVSGQQIADDWWENKAECTESLMSAMKGKH